MPSKNKLHCCINYAARRYCAHMCIKLCDGVIYNVWHISATLRFLDAVLLRWMQPAGDSRLGASDRIHTKNIDYSIYRPQAAASAGGVGGGSRLQRMELYYTRAACRYSFYCTRFLRVVLRLRLSPRNRCTSEGLIGYTCMFLGHYRHPRSYIVPSRCFLCDRLY